MSSTYARAVATVRQLTSAPVEAAFDGPRKLARAAGLAPSSGYRAIAQAEAMGFLLRDGEGLYGPGKEARRIGLSALGFGDLAMVCDPILLRLRDAASLTAFLGVLRGRSLSVGPFAMGRGAGYAVPVRRAEFATRPPWQGADVPPGLYVLDAAGRRLGVIAAPIEERGPNGWSVVGVSLARLRRGDAGAIADAVDKARARFLSASGAGN